MTTIIGKLIKIDRMQVTNCYACNGIQNKLKLNTFFDDVSSGNQTQYNNFNFLGCFY
jgi:hypothetical protein